MDLPAKLLGEIGPSRSDNALVKVNATEFDMGIESVSKLKERPD